VTEGNVMCYAVSVMLCYRLGQTNGNVVVRCN